MKTSHLIARTRSSKRRLSVGPAASATSTKPIVPSIEPDRDAATWDRSNLDPTVLSQRIRAGATVH